jgi:hypothetical protein
MNDTPARAHPRTMPHNSALLYYVPATEGCTDFYRGLLVLSPEMITAADGGLWLTITRRKGTTPSHTVLQLEAAASWGDPTSAATRSTGASSSALPPSSASRAIDGSGAASPAAAGPQPAMPASSCGKPSRRTSSRSARGPSIR